MSALILDHNLSPHLARRVADVFPNAIHVRDCGLERADDSTLWEFARSEGRCIVTKDDDFRQLSFLRGAPPKVVWVHLGNCRTDDVERLLRARRDDIESFLCRRALGSTSIDAVRQMISAGSLGTAAC